MRNAQTKVKRLYIPIRDDEVAEPKPVLGENCNHDEQVVNAFNTGFSRYKNAMKELSKV